MSSHINVFIPEPIPSGNKGEEAILRGILEGFQNAKIDAHFTLFSYDLSSDQKNYSGAVQVVGGFSFRPLPRRPIVLRSLEATWIWMRLLFFLLCRPILRNRIYTIFRAPIWRAWGESDLILVGHDGFISDLNVFLTLYVWALGKKSALIGGGFRRFKLAVTERLAAFALDRLLVISVRELHTHDYLAALGVDRTKLMYCPDPAFLMPSGSDERAKQILHDAGINTTDSKPLIGMIALTNTAYYRYFFGVGLSEADRFEQQLALFVKLCDELLENTDGLIVFIPHALATTLGTDDRYCGREIKKRVKESQRVILIEKEYSAMELKALIARLDFLLSQRLHAVINASSVATPFLMLTVREDLRSHDIISNTLRLPQQMLDINESGYTTACDLALQLWNRRAEVRQSMLENIAGVRQRAQSCFDTLGARIHL